MAIATRVVASSLFSVGLRTRLAGWVSLGAMSLLMGGCASSPDLPKDHALKSAYAWAAYRQPVDADSLKYFPSAKIGGGNGYRTLSFSNSPGGNGEEKRWAEGFRRACLRQSGRLDANLMCRAGDDPDTILFAVKMKSSYGSSSRIEMSFLEPTVQPATPEYQETLQRAGFVPESVAQERRQFAAVEAESRREREEARSRLNWQMMRERGRTVCTERDGVRYVGFVEDFTDSRMKVSISRAYFVRTPSFAPGNFRPEVIWTGPAGWAPCD